MRCSWRCSVINRVDLKTFKCFDLLRLPLGHLTLLSGVNASGKSSVLQSLVLLHQTMQENEWSTRIMLNGDVARLGTVTDVVDQEHGRNSFEIGLADDEASCHWSFSGERSDMSLEVARVVVNGETTEKPSDLRFLLPSPVEDPVHELIGLIRNLTYITAEREGPREVYPLEDEYAGFELEHLGESGMDSTQDHHAIARVGSRGENAISVLYRGRDELVADGLRIPDIVPTLIRQFEARMDTFFPGFGVNVQQIPNANAVVLGIRISQATGFLRPIHCGFGITQVLPIVVAVLSVPKGGLLLIENPEVHLHPAGQALMGQFLADAAQSGIQVIVETHSDHVLNGIRRAVKAGRLPAEKVALHFFRARSVDSPQALSPIIDSSGNVDVWPEGFFDQFDRDMDYFAGWGE